VRVERIHREVCNAEARPQRTRIQRTAADNECRQRCSTAP